MLNTYKLLFSESFLSLIFHMVIRVGSSTFVLSWFCSFQNLFFLFGRLITFYAFLILYFYIFSFFFFCFECFLLLLLCLILNIYYNNPFNLFFFLFVAFFFYIVFTKFFIIFNFSNKLSRFIKHTFYLLIKHLYSLSLMCFYQKMCILKFRSIKYQQNKKY